MTRKWQEVSLEKAKQHPLYGVKNWLAVFAFGALFGVFRELAALGSEATQAGMTIGQLFAIEHPAITFAKISLIFDIASVAVIYWLLLTKHPKFRPVASIVLLCNWPSVALIGVANSFPGLGRALAESFFPWAIACAVWVTYLQRSRRVRVTFEHRVLSAEGGVVGSQRQRDTIIDWRRVKDHTDGSNAELRHQQAATQIVQPSSSDSSRPTQRDRPPAAPMHQHTPTSVVLATEPEEEHWALALAEFEGDARRPGLWVRAFAEAQGNEAIAKANYLRYRVDELRQEQATLFEHERLLAEATERTAELAHLSAKQREYAMLPKGTCPNCKAIIPLNAKGCPNCIAVFGDNAKWKVHPIDEKDQIAMLRWQHLSGKNLTIDEVIFLASASSRDRSLASVSDRFRGQTLLHWAAKFGLKHEASLLIANGANATVPDGIGQKPFQLGEDLELRDVLRTAAHAE